MFMVIVTLNIQGNRYHECSRYCIHGLAHADHVVWWSDLVWCGLVWYGLMVWSGLASPRLVWSWSCDEVWF